MELNSGQQLSEGVGTNRQRECIAAECRCGAHHVRGYSGGEEEKHPDAGVFDGAERVARALPMVAVDDQLRAPQSRASIGGRFALLHENRPIAAKLDEQTQQRGNNLFPRKN